MITSQRRVARRRNGRASAVCRCRFGPRRSKRRRPTSVSVGVDLDAVDARRREEVAVGARGRAGGVAEDRDRARRAAARSRTGARASRPSSRRSATRPGGRRECTAWPSLSSRRRSPSGRSIDARVLVLGLALPDHARVAGRLHGADRDREQQRATADRRRATKRRAAAPATATSASASAKTRNVRRVPTSGMRTSALRKVPTRRAERSRSRTGARRRARPPRPCARSGAPRRARRRPAASPARRRARARRAASRRRPRPATRSSAWTEMRRNGPATNGTSASSTAAHRTTRLRPRERRVAVGQAPADPVAGAQRHQHRRDGVGPHDGGRAEPRRQQPRGSDLGAERSGADHGREDLDATRGHLGHPRRFVRFRS